jgi:predicted nucleic acid-binding protein
MRFVLDNSVAVRWYFDDQATDYSRAVLESLSSAVPVVPVLWLSEFVNATLRARRRKAISASRYRTIMRDVGRLSIAVDATVPSLSRLSALAIRRRLSAYDATYLELSLRARLPLATEDLDLLKAAKRAGVAIFDPRGNEDKQS